MSPEELVAWNVAIILATLAGLASFVAAIIVLLRGNLVAGAMLVAGGWTLGFWAHRTAQRVPELPTR